MRTEGRLVYKLPLLVEEFGYLAVGGAVHILLSVLAIVKVPSHMAASNRLRR